MATHMKALQVIAPEDFEIREVPVPIPGPGEVLLRVNAVTTCPQWDLHLRHNEPMFLGHQFHYPYALGQPGHEATGVIEDARHNVYALAHRPNFLAGRTAAGYPSRIWNRSRRSNPSSDAAEGR